MSPGSCFDFLSLLLGSFLSFISSLIFLCFSFFDLFYPCHHHHHHHHRHRRRQGACVRFHHRHRRLLLSRSLPSPPPLSLGWGILSPCGAKAPAPYQAISERSLGSVKVKVGCAVIVAVEQNVTPGDGGNYVNSHGDATSRESS